MPCLLNSSSADVNILIMMTGDQVLWEDLEADQILTSLAALAVLWLPKKKKKLFILKTHVERVLRCTSLGV